MNPLADLLFPPVCVGCGERIAFRGFPKPRSEAFCPSCAEQWEAAKREVCGICQQPVAVCACVPEELEHAGCRSFRKLVYYRPGNRDEVQNRVIYHIKDSPDREAVRFLADELCERVRDALSEDPFAGKRAFLVWLPRGRNAVLNTGTDQAKELARALSERLSIPVYPMLSRRFGHGKQQKLLSPAERKRNAAKAFCVTPLPEAKGGCAVLVDDIVTSGASMAAAVRLLRRAGVRQFLSVAVASDESNRNPPAKQPQMETELDRIRASLHQ